MPSLVELKIAAPRDFDRYSETYTNLILHQQEKNLEVKLPAEGMIFDIRYSNMSTNRGNRLANVERSTWTADIMQRSRLKTKNRDSHISQSRPVIPLRKTHQFFNN